MTMQCDNAMLAAYLDGEVDDAQAAMVRAHVAGCPACAVEVASAMALRRGVQAARGKFVPSPEFRLRLQRQVIGKKKKTPVRWWMPAGAFVAAVLVIAVMWTGQRADGYGEVADLHVNAMASANPLDVVSTDRHTVKPWFQGRIPFSFNVPELGGTGYVLEGGRMAYFEQRPGAQLIVGMKQHRISVLIFQESGEMARAFAGGGVKTRNSFQVETWASGGLRFVVIGDAEAGAIDGLAEQLRKANP